MARRRYVVKMVTTSPGWTGTCWAFGCKHLDSAEALFARASAEASGGALLLLDREERRVIRSIGCTDPVKTADYFGW
jgi:hypothetical protein